MPARCGDGSAPLHAGDGSFSCNDGSKPECEDGATPKVSNNGKSLVCLVAAAGGASAGETECEEEEPSCGTGSESGEQACEASGEDSSPACEGEG